MMMIIETKQQSAKYGGIVGFAISLLAVYTLLLMPSHDVVSISAIIQLAAKMSDDMQLVIIALVPVYLSIILFGGSALGWYIGKRVSERLSKSEKKICKKTTIL